MTIEQSDPRETALRVLINLLRQTRSSGAYITLKNHHVFMAVTCAHDAPREEFPLEHAGKRVGMLCLQGVQNISFEKHQPLLNALSRAVVVALEAAAKPDPKTVLERALTENRWNILRAAKALGVTRRTVYLRLQKFGLARP